MSNKCLKHLFFKLLETKKKLIYKAVKLGVYNNPDIITSEFE